MVQRGADRSCSVLVAATDHWHNWAADAQRLCRCCHLVAEARTLGTKGKFEILPGWIVGHPPWHMLLPVAEAGRSNNDPAREASTHGRGQSIIPGGILVSLVELGNADSGGDQIFCLVLLQFEDEHMKALEDFLLLLLSSLVDDLQPHKEQRCWNNNVPPPPDPNITMSIRHDGGLLQGSLDSKHLNVGTLQLVQHVAISHDVCQEVLWRTYLPRKKMPWRTWIKRNDEQNHWWGFSSFRRFQLTYFIHQLGVNFWTQFSHFCDDQESVPYEEVLLRELLKPGTTKCHHQSQEHSVRRQH